MRADSIREAYAFLESRRSLYPAGIPRDVIRSTELAPSLSSSLSFYPAPSEPCLLVVRPVGDAQQIPYAEEDGKLLRAAVERGLGFDAERIAHLHVVVGAEEKNGVEVNFDVVSERTAAPLVVVCGAGVVRSEGGEELQMGELVCVGAARVLLTHALSEVRASRSVKREFWEHLQRIASHVSE